VASISFNIQGVEGGELEEERKREGKLEQER